MLLVRKGLVHLLALILLVTLLGIAGTINFNRSLGQPDKFKQLLAESGVYDHVAVAALENAQEEAVKDGTDVSVALDESIVLQAANRTFTPQLAEQTAGTLIDANYAWLSGQTPQPEFRVDLTETKQQFIKLTTDYIVNRLRTLPACTPEQVSQLQLPVDPMKISCLPPGIDPQTEAERVGKTINESDFLSQPVITPQTLGRDEQSQTEEPYYQELSQAPRLYQLAQKAPLILGVIALLSALLIIVIAPSRRHGLRRVGWVLVVAGVLMIATKFLAGTLASRLESRLDNTISKQLEGPRDDFFNHLASQITQVNLIIGISCLVLGLAILIWILSTRGSKRPPSSPQPPAPTRNPQLAARPPQPNLDITGARTTSPPTAPPVVGSPQPPQPLGKQPPKPRRPRLIQ